jgi:hypothetical protein
MNAALPNWFCGDTIGGIRTPISDGSKVLECGLS